MLIITLPFSAFSARKSQGHHPGLRIVFSLHKPSSPPGPIKVFMSFPPPRCFCVVSTARPVLGFRGKGGFSSPSLPRPRSVDTAVS